MRYAIFLIAALALTLPACGGDDETSNGEGIPGRSGSLIQESWFDANGVLVRERRDAKSINAIIEEIRRLEADKDAEAHAERIKELRRAIGFGGGFVRFRGFTVINTDPQFELVNPIISGLNDWDGEVLPELPPPGPPPPAPATTATDHAKENNCDLFCGPYAKTIILAENDEAVWDDADITDFCRVHRVTLTFRFVDKVDPLNMKDCEYVFDVTWDITKLHYFDDVTVEVDTSSATVKTVKGAKRDDLTIRVGEPGFDDNDAPSAVVTLVSGQCVDVVR